MIQTEPEHDSLTGRWEGSFEFQSQKTNMAVDFSANKISISQQGLQNYPIEDISYEAPEISFKVALGASWRKPCSESSTRVNRRLPPGLCSGSSWKPAVALRTPARREPQP
jgi:hypothetical protein